MKHLHSQASVKVNGQPYSLSYGSDLRVFCYSGCNVNGVRYHVEERDDGLLTQNSGIVVRGEHDNDEIDFYGVLTDVIELQYIFNFRVVLFKCK